MITSKIRVGFDAKRYFFNRSGLGNYSRSTVFALIKYTDDILPVLITSKKPHRHWRESSIPDSELSKNGFIEAVSPKNKNFAWRTFGMGKFAGSQRLTAFHGLSNEMPINLPANIQKICTIHDVIFKDHPSHYSLFDRTVYDLKTKHAVKVSDTIVVTSMVTEQSLLKHYPKASGKTQVIYQPIHPDFYLDKAGFPTPQTSYNLQHPYVIYHSTFNKRKNHIRLLEASAQIRDQVDFHLVLVGIEGNTSKLVQEYISEYRLGHLVHVFDYVSQSELIGLCKSAKGFIYPSISEGFGIPLAEAAACNIPIAISRIPIFAELIGDSTGVLDFDPRSEQELMKALIQLQNLITDREKGIDTQIQMRKVILDKVNPAEIARKLKQLYLK